MRYTPHKQPQRQAGNPITMRFYASLIVASALLLPMAADARIMRSQSAKVEFKYENPFPAK